MTTDWVFCNVIKLYFKKLLWLILKQNTLKKIWIYRFIEWKNRFINFFLQRNIHPKIDYQIQGLNYETQFFSIFLMADHYVGAFLLLPLSISYMCVAFFTSNSFATIVFLKISGIESMWFRENTVGCDLPPTENTLFFRLSRWRIILCLKLWKYAYNAYKLQLSIYNLCVFKEMSS